MRPAPPVPRLPEIAVWRLVPSARPTWQAGTLRYDAALGGWSWDDGVGPEDAEADVPKAYWTPPLLDAHTHLGDAFLRPERDRLPRRLEELVAPPDGYKHRRLRDTPAMTVRAAIHERAQQMTRLGTGHAIDFREGGAPGLKVLLTALEGTVLGVSAYGRPAASPDDRDLWLRELDELLHDTPVAGIGLSGLNDLPQALLDAAADSAQSARRPLALHLSEARHEPMDAALALSPRLLVHLVHATNQELDAMADADVLAVTCPSSNRFFGMRPPLAALHAASIDSGLPVAFGTDNAMLGDGDLRDELRTAAAALPAATWDWLMQAATWRPWRHLALGPPTADPGLLWGVHPRLPSMHPMDLPLSGCAALLRAPPYQAPAF